MSQATDDPLRDATSNLMQLRDEMRLKVHLAGMDARKRWEEDLGPRLDSLYKGLSTRARKGADEARLQAHLGMKELGSKWATLEPRLLELVDQILAAGRAADGGRLGSLIHGTKDALGRVKE